MRGRIILQLDDQPGAARDLLKARFAAFRAAVAAEMRRLRDPPLTDDEGRAASFELRSFFRGYSDARRMMGDADAQTQLIEAFEALLERTAGPSGEGSLQARSPNSAPDGGQRIRSRTNADFEEPKHAHDAKSRT